MGTPQNNVVIAGVGPGLGATLARKFANHDYNIGLLARNQEYLNQLVDEMNQDKQIALALPTDLMDPIQIESAFQQFTKTFGTVDILINHANGSFWKSVEEFVTQLKINRLFRYSVISGFVILAYLLGGAIAVLIAVCGVFLGRLSYNDIVDDLDI